MAALFATDPLSLSVASFLIQARNCLTQLTTLVNAGTRLVWNNPTGATPQQVCDALGTQAGAVFAAAQGLALLLEQVTGVLPATTPANWSAVVNADGTVTVTQNS